MKPFNNCQRQGNFSTALCTVERTGLRVDVFASVCLVCLYVFLSWLLKSGLCVSMHAHAGQCSFGTTLWGLSVLLID